MSRGEKTSSVTKISESRTRKALSIASLIWCAVQEDAIIRINSSKDSYYAEKVFVGSQVMVDGTTYQKSDILTIGSFFDTSLHPVVDKVKSRKGSELVVDDRVIGTYTPGHYKMQEDTNSKIRNKNQESSFSNFLAYILVKKGYILTTSTKKLKKSTKTIQFYNWIRIQKPSGGIDFKVSEEHETLRKFIELIRHTTGVQLQRQFSISDLQNGMALSELSNNGMLCRQVEQHQWLSAFRPSTAIYEVKTSVNVYIDNVE